MYKAILVKKVYPCHCLYEKVKCLIFTELTRPLPWPDNPKEAALLNILQNQIDKLRILKTRVQPHDVHVSEPLLYRNLALQCLPNLHRCKRLLVYLLYCNAYPARSMHRFGDSPISSSPYLLRLNIQFTQCDVGQDLLSLHSISRKKLALLNERCCLLYFYRLLDV